MTIVMTNFDYNRGSILENALAEIMCVLFFEEELSNLFRVEHGTFIELLNRVNSILVVGVFAALLICSSHQAKRNQDWYEELTRCTYTLSHCFD